MHLCGSFTNWLETVPIAIEPNPTGGEVFAVVCNLPPGYHQYKFIVDGEWRHDENQAFIQDPLGNVNNWLFVKKPGAANEPSPGSETPFWFLSCAKMKSHRPSHAWRHCSALMRMRRQ